MRICYLLLVFCFCAAGKHRMNLKFFFFRTIAGNRLLCDTNLEDPRFADFYLKTGGILFLFVLLLCAIFFFFFGFLLRLLFFINMIYLECSMFINGNHDPMNVYPYANLSQVSGESIGFKVAGVLF